MGGMQDRASIHLASKQDRMFSSIKHAAMHRTNIMHVSNIMAIASTLSCLVPRLSNGQSHSSLMVEGG